MIAQVAVVPTTPLALSDTPGRRQPEVAAIGAAAGRVTDGLSAVDVVVMLSGGATLGVHSPPATTLAGYGLDLPAHVLAPAPDPVTGALAAAMGLRAHSIGLAGPDLAVLARWAPVGSRCVGVTLPSDVSAATAESVAVAVGELAEVHAIGVLVAGDLGAGHGIKPPRPDAAAASSTLDGIVIAALDNGRHADLTRLDTALIVASGCRAAGALAVLGRLLDRVRLGTVVRATAAPLGVGYVVAQGG